MIDHDFYAQWPDPESLSRFVSWRETERRGDIYFEPEFPAERITRNTAYTVGTVWFPDDTDHLALVRVANDRIIGVTVYEDSDIWVLRPSTNTFEWFQEKIDLMYSSIEIDLNDETRFPLRIATDLVNPVLRETMRMRILKGGLPARWDTS